MISDRIRERRTVAGWTQARLAEKLDVSAKAVSHWESGYREPDLATIQGLAHALGTTISYLVGETDDPSPPPTVAAAHQRAEPGTPLPPETQLIVERAIRNAIKEIYGRDRSRKKEKDPNGDNPIGK